MQNYNFSPTKNNSSATLRDVDQQLLQNMQLYQEKGLSPTETTRLLVRKGWTVPAIRQAQEQLGSPKAVTATSAQQEQKVLWAMRLFRFGFAGVFLINALIAYIQPHDFLSLLEKSLATNWIGRLEWLIPVIAVNDFALAVVMLAAPRRFRPYVYAWTGLWFLAITVIKLLALNVFTS